MVEHGAQAYEDDFDDGRGNRLDGLQAHADHFQVAVSSDSVAADRDLDRHSSSRVRVQVEAFFKALAKGGKGFSLFKRKSKAPGAAATTGSGGFTLDDLLMFSNVSDLLSSTA